MDKYEVHGFADRVFVLKIPLMNFLIVGFHCKKIEEVTDER